MFAVHVWPGLAFECAQNGTTVVLEPGETWSWRCGLPEPGLVQGTLTMQGGRHSYGTVVFNDTETIRTWHLQYDHTVTLRDIECSTGDCTIEVGCEHGFYCVVEVDGAMRPLSFIPLQFFITTEGDCRSACQAVLWVGGVLLGFAIGLTVAVVSLCVRATSRSRSVARSKMVTIMTTVGLLVCAPGSHAVWTEGVPYDIGADELLYIPSNHTLRAASGNISDWGSCQSPTGCVGRYSYWTPFDRVLHASCVWRHAHMYVPPGNRSVVACDADPIMRNININVGVVRPHARGKVLFRNETTPHTIYHGVGSTYKHDALCSTESRTCRLALTCTKAPDALGCVFELHGAMVPLPQLQSAPPLGSSPEMDCDSGCQRRIWAISLSSGISGFFFLYFCWRCFCRKHRK